MPMDEADGEDSLDRLAEELAERLRRGERPAPEEYFDRFPGLAHRIPELLSAANTLIVAEGAPRLPEFIETPAAMPSRVGDYRIIRQVGRGGMGVVYEAEQVSLGRRVALKVLPLQGARDLTTLERFRREARASARLHHTNIVPVFEVGQDGEVRYYAMQFIEGRSLDAVIDELRRLRGVSRRHRGVGLEKTIQLETPRVVLDDGVEGPLPSERAAPRPPVEELVATSPWVPDPSAESGANGPRRPAPSAVLPGGIQLAVADSRFETLHLGVAQIGQQVASALAHAHARGITHRDVKPSNILLDSEGVAWVTDFGLARLDDDLDLTRTGDLVGTLRYLPPERLQGRGDARSDLYGLGLTLYELMTLRVAFDSGDRAALIEQIRNADPPRPRTLDPRIPRDLETIVLKAIEKEPENRYASAEAMAEDLRRYLAGETIQARRVTAPERYLRWARRNPLIAIMGGLLTALLVLITVGSLLAARWFRDQAEVQKQLAEARETERRDADLARLKADEANHRLLRTEETLQRTVYATRSNLALAAWETSDVGRLLSLVGLMKPQQGDPDIRGWEWRYLWQLGHEARMNLAAPGRPRLGKLRISPDGKSIAVLDFDGRIHFWDRRSGTPRLTTQPVCPGEPPDLARGVHGIAFNPDGSRLAGPGPNRSLVIYNVADGKIVGQVDGRTDAVLDVSWSPDGRYLVYAVSKHVMRVWDVREGRLLHDKFGGHRGPVATLAFDDRGRLLASGSFDRTVKLWSLDDRSHPRAILEGHMDEVRAVAFSPDGTRVASGGLDGTIRIWNTQSGTPVAVLRGHQGPVCSLGYLPGGARLVSGSSDQSVRIWDAESGEELRVFRCDGAVESLAVSSDGADIAAVAQASVQVWSPDNPPRPLTLRSPSLLTYGGSVESIAFSPDGSRFVTGHEDWAVRVWDLASRKPPVLLRGHTDIVHSVAYSPNGRTVASASGDGSVRVWDLESGQPLAILVGSGQPVRTLAYSLDGETLFSAGDDQEIRVWDVNTQAERHVLPGHVGRITHLESSPDGRTLASASLDDTCRLWDLPTGRTRAILRGHVEAVSGVAFSANGKLIATSSFDRSVRLWDAARGEPLSVLSGHLDFVNCVAFSPDGRLVSGGKDRTIRLWDTSSGQAVLVLKGHSGSVSALRFSGDGSTLGSASRDRTIKLWEAGPASVLNDD